MYNAEVADTRDQLNIDTKGPLQGIRLGGPFVFI